MSAKFIWVRNPTAINGLATTYVSLRGSDTNGDGTAQNPYRSLAKATTVAAANTNIMLDDGDWNEARTANNRAFRFYGNAKTEFLQSEADGTAYPSNTEFHNFYKTFGIGGNQKKVYFYNCNIDCIKGTYNWGPYLIFYNCVLLDSKNLGRNFQDFMYLYNCVCCEQFKYNKVHAYDTIFHSQRRFDNSSILNHCNFTNSPIPSTAVNSINDETTGQTIANYLNYIHPNVLANPNTATIDDWLACDFTAKPGSANIGAGENGSTIGLNQGYPARATNDSNDIFAAANGATLRNVAWNATLNGYSLVHKDKVCAGYTVNTITLAADAEAIDDYYNGLFIGITAGDGAGEIHRIVDYDGATRVATIDTSWQSAISTSSIYSISGTIDSATKDFGRVIKVKRNWAFLANMQSWTDPNDSSYGRWKEFLTSPLQNNGEWMMRPCNNFRYEYSIDNIEWHSSTELLAGTDSDNKTYNAAYGNASESYVAANAKTTVLRYVRYHIEIGFNIGEDAQ